MKRNLILLMMIIASVISCEKADRSGSLIKNTNGEYAILFRSQSTKAVATTISGNHYDDFSLFTWNSNGDLVMNPYLVKASGVGEYQYDEVDGQELKYFKRTADNYYFLGIIPSDHTMSKSGDEVTVEDLVSFTVDDNRASGTIEADSKEEFLFGSKTVPRVSYGSPVLLSLNHGNAILWLGFKSDRDDTQILDYVPRVQGVPAYSDTTDTWINLKRGSNVDGSATKLKGPNETSYTTATPLPTSLVNEIKSYYSINSGDPGDYDLHMGSSVWPSNEVRQLRIVKTIPTAYKMNVETPNGTVVAVFDGFKYLKDNGYEIKPADSGGKPDVWNYVLIDAFVNGSAYTVVGLNATGVSYSNPNYTIVEHPEVPSMPGLPGTRVFSADRQLGIDSKYHYIHKAHTTQANATLTLGESSINWSNRLTSSDAIVFALPAMTTLESTKFSPSTFYAIPGDPDLNYLVVKLSYVYNGTSVYDIRVPIKLPDEGLVAGKYYRYTINITSISDGGTTQSNALDEKDEIDTANYPIEVIIQPSQYTEGANEIIVI